MVCVSSIPLTLQRGTFPTDAWLTIEVSAEGVEVLEMADWTRDEDVDFLPALSWAADCSLQGTPAVPEGWRIKECIDA